LGIRALGNRETRAAVLPQLLNDVTTMTGGFAAALLPVLDQLLTTRIDGFATDEYISGAGAGVAVLVAYLMMAFYRSATSQLTGMADALDGLAAGDLTRRRPVITRDEVGRMATAFNHAVSQLHEVMTGLDHSTGRVTDSAQELTEVNQQLHGQARGTAKLATAVGVAAQSASHDVHSLSAGSEQMLAATQEIARSATADPGFGFDHPDGLVR
jgi:methyl-accepting chemotaxis protein